MISPGVCGDLRRTRVKVCGLTRAGDVEAAVTAGVDAIGLVFYPQSPRFVAPEAAAVLAARVPPYVTVVGLFVNAGRDGVHRVLDAVSLGALQFHGDETPEDCTGFGLSWTRAVRMTADTDLLQYARLYSGAAGLLLDAHVAGVPGGTGQRFDWSLVPESFPLPLVLSGGLHPDNVREAIRRLRPHAVDVSSGVEAARGIKDAGRIRAFMQGVFDADREAS